MRKTHKSVFFILLVLIVAISYIAVFGIYTVYGEITTTVVKGVKDLDFDKSVAYSATIALAADTENTEVTAQQLDAAKLAVGKRLDYYGYIDYEIYVDYENAKLLIELPWASYAETTVSAVAATINTPGLFEVRLGNEKDDDGNPTGTTLETVLFSNEIIKDVSIDTSLYYFYTLSTDISLTRAGNKAFNAKLAQLLADSESGVVVSYWFDGEFWGTRTFTEASLNSEIAITSSSSSSSAMNSTYSELIERQAALLCGVLPVEFTVEGTAQYVPTDMQPSYLMLYLAGGISLLAALLFIIVYKLPGLSAALMVVFYSGVSAAVFTGVFTDVNRTYLTFANFAAYFAGLFMLCFGCAMLCTRFSRYVSEGMSSMRAVKTAFDKHGSKVSLAFAAAFAAALALKITASIPALGRGSIISLSAVSSFAGLAMIFTVVAFAGLLLFVLAALSLSSDSNRMNSAYCSFAYSAGKQVKSAKKALTVAVCIVVLVAAAAGAAAYISGAGYSMQHDGAVVITKSFTDGELKTDKLLESVNALAEGVTSEYQYSSNGSRYALVITAPVQSGLTSEQVTELLTATDEKAFTDVLSGSFSGCMSIVDFAVLGGWAVAAALLAAAFTAIFSFRVKKSAAFLAVLLSGVLGACVALGAMIVCGVEITYAMLALFCAAVIGGVFTSAWCVFSADAEKPRHKRESNEVCCALAYQTSVYGAVSAFVCIALTLAAAVVLCVVSGIAVLTAFSVGLLACALCSSVGAYFMSSLWVIR